MESSVWLYLRAMRHNMPWVIICNKIRKISYMISQKLSLQPFLVAHTLMDVITSQDESGTSATIMSSPCPEIRLRAIAKRKETVNLSCSL